jgi:hypothetical protein
MGKIVKQEGGEMMQDLLIQIIFGGFTLMFALMIIIYNTMMSGFKRMESKMDKMDDKITDIDRRLCRIEGAMAAKECCAITQKNDRGAV